MLTCQYQNIFGAPGEGPHSYRFMGVAAVDIFLTILAAIAIAATTNRSLLKTFGVLMIVAIFFHWMFCVPTTITRALGLV